MGHFPPYFRLRTLSCCSRLLLTDVKLVSPNGDCGSSALISRRATHLDTQLHAVPSSIAGPGQRIIGPVGVGLTWYRGSLDLGLVTDDERAADVPTSAAACQGGVIGTSTQTSGFSRHRLCVCTSAHRSGDHSSSPKESLTSKLVLHSLRRPQHQLHSAVA
ncbi:uncharacterized protein CC84DRAFT_835783 [Paraphaeosphaeria sporulosa]|uniref:Uncharacterized protein n=1 Tax=Paraphaeosphaeria sporulosa TaxID=1460663 RepID=A0A177C9H6_9PLEO|nr:uncharacterized protein CC84DRAFT_835783 [Paraphaeosphaeria sporulosa]OAG03407.1 hypothetical protein CC84DRAFT_835783 [Paraphaeosphaeria sporulosa]